MVQDYERHKISVGERARQTRADYHQQREEARRLKLAKAPRPLSGEKAALAVARWSRKHLKVPPGHENAGAPMVLPRFFTAFLKEALITGVRESGCFVARKNAKSACVAVLILAHLADTGPLRSAGWRAGIASLSISKASELWEQIREIAEASGLAEIKSRKSPRSISSDWGRAEILSADKSSGHASGFDLAVCDELGLFPEKGRDLVAGLYTSTSAKNGRLIAISVIGDSPLTEEMIERSETDPACVVHTHRAPEGCSLDDRKAWKLANPTLGKIKSLSYMRDAARRAAGNPSEQSSFRAFDMNQPATPGKEIIVSVADFARCSDREQPEREGRCFVGFDCGGSASMTAAAIAWPNGRLEIYGAFGDNPDLKTRGEADGVKDRYLRMEERGELVTFPGRVTPVSGFIRWLKSKLIGEIVAVGLADRYRQAEAMDALSEADCYWPMEWRAQGTGKDGSADVRSFQKLIMNETLRPGHSLILTSAVRESIIRYDPNGNPALNKRRQKGRIDALAAAILAVGAMDRYSLEDEDDVQFFRPEQPAFDNAYS